MFKKFQFKRTIYAALILGTVPYFIVISLFIVSFNHNFYDSLVISQTQDHIQLLSKTLNKKIKYILSNAETLVNIYIPLLEKLDSETGVPDNALTLSLLASAHGHPQIASIYYGMQNGYFLEVASLRLIKDSSVFKGLGGAVPDHSESFVLEISHLGQNSAEQVDEKWRFLKSDNTFTVPVAAHKTSYDHRSRDWYSKALKTPDLFWTDVYVFASAPKEVGLSVVKIVSDSTKNTKGVFGIDVTLSSLSSLLSTAKMSPGAKTYIIDSQDRIIASSCDVSNIAPSDGHYQLPNINNSQEYPLKEAYLLYKAKETKEEVVFFSHQNISYISVFDDVPKNLGNGNKWQIVSIVPLDDFTAEITNRHYHMCCLLFFIILVRLVFSYRLARRISGPIMQLSDEANKIKDLKFDVKNPVESKIIEIQALSDAIGAMRTSIQAFSYYVPRTLVKKLLNQKHAIHVGGKEKEVTLFFSDIVGFTTVSENVPAEKLVLQLSAYFEELEKIITKNDGTIDKYIGDSIMAFWGAPIPDRNHDFNACQSAVLCCGRLEALNKAWEAEGKPVFKTRIGIHTGEVIIGNIGSSERMNYTAIGDSVNLCSRLEGLNKLYGTNIIISGSVFDKVGDQFFTRILDKVAVKGKSKSIKIYELLGQKNDDPAAIIPTEQTQEFVRLFEKAYTLYVTRQWREALNEFMDIDKNIRPGDLSVSLYIGRCIECIQDPPPPDWDGSNHIIEK
ncbi:MAG: cache domain-containing protein [Alphaproteobacteria bacterium]|nr:cache domain-containing protein [Alphaproteobacteria bacterium]